MDSTKEKNAVTKLRERFFEIKRNLKPSERLRDLVKIDDEENTEEKDKNKKVARTPMKQVFNAHQT